MPGNAEVRNSANGYPSLTGGRHHPERNTVIGAQDCSANRSVSFEKPRSLVKGQSLEVPIEAGNLEDHWFSAPLEHSRCTGIVIGRKLRVAANERAGSAQILTERMSTWTVHCALQYFLDRP